MLFSSTIFLFVFLPIVFLGYFIVFKKSRNLQNLFLLLMSIFFYAYGEKKFVYIMLLSIISNYFFALGIDFFKHHAIKKVVLTLSVIFNVGLLFIYKYLIFTIGIFNDVFFAQIIPPEIVLPIGISFFTFQSLSYVFDVYYGKHAVQKNPFWVGLYISFFPQLIAGPIVRYDVFSDQIKNRRESIEQFANGTLLFCTGFSKKVIFSNTFAVVADLAFGTSSTGGLSVCLAWLGAICYTLQIYYDFSGYSDMAIGLAAMFGFKFPKNFDYPYISKSITEFWRRWHISLGTWFRDYVYIPLGGSRVKTVSRHIFNLFVVWLLTGIWHGANFTFIVWGLMYFVLLMAEKYFNIDKKLGKASNLYTMLFVMFGWVIFRAENIGQAVRYLGAMFGIGSAGLTGNMFTMSIRENIVLLIFGIVLCTPVLQNIGKRLCKKYDFLKYVYILGVFVIFIVSVTFILKGTYNPFIYFNF